MSTTLDQKALEALRLYDIYDRMPSDRGGKTGPRGKAYQAFLDAKNDAQTSVRPVEGRDEALAALTTETATPEGQQVAIGGSTTAYTRDQLAKLAFVLFYSPVLCAPQNIKSIVDEIDCCPGCDHVSNGGTCSVSERGDYCPNDLAEALRQISVALYGPGEPSHYVASVFGPDKVASLRPASPAGEGRVAVKPFGDMAGEMFARGWNVANVALALDNPDDPHRVTAGDFFAARQALSLTPSSALSAVRDEALEEAARYHDGKAAELAASMDQDDGHFGAAHAVHIFAASTFRSMKGDGDG